MSVDRSSVRHDVRCITMNQLVLNCIRMAETIVAFCVVSAAKCVPVWAKAPQEKLLMEKKLLRLSICGSLWEHVTNYADTRDIHTHTPWLKSDCRNMDIVIEFALFSPFSMILFEMCHSTCQAFGNEYVRLYDMWSRCSSRNEFSFIYSVASPLISCPIRPACETHSDFYFIFFASWYGRPQRICKSTLLLPSGREQKTKKKKCKYTTSAEA